jgi:hypothetical protein
MGNRASQAPHPCCIIFFQPTPIKALRHCCSSITTSACCSLRSRAEDDFFYRNGQGDKLIFVSDGEGVLDTQFGDLPFRRGDYLMMPRGLWRRKSAPTPSPLACRPTIDSIQDRFLRITGSNIPASSSTALRAICSIHSFVRCNVIPAKVTRRVSRCRKNRTLYVAKPRRDWPALRLFDHSPSTRILTAILTSSWTTSDLTGGLPG